MSYEKKYLNLLERAIGEGLHGPSCRPLPEYSRDNHWFTVPLDLVAWLVRKLGFVLCLPPTTVNWPTKEDTMVTTSALRNIRQTLENCVEWGIRGAYVECGVWRGGSCVYAKAVLEALRDNRPVYGCDSFEGLPRPTGNDPADDIHYTYRPLAADFDGVKQVCRKYGVGEINWVKGFFKDSLPGMVNNIGKIAVLRCDGDLYSSTMDIFTNLYPIVVPGGFIIIDDYAKLPQCKAAVHDYLGFDPNPINVSSDGVVMFRKPKS